MTKNKQRYPGLIPVQCWLCRGDSESTRVICRACVQDLPGLTASCFTCARALPDGGICGRCLQTPPAIDHTLAAYQYRYPIDKIIKNYKYYQQLELIQPLLEGLVETIRGDDLELPEMIIPVPMHPLRQLVRGFNQAHAIAAHLARTLSVPLATSLLLRKRHTRPQSNLSARERVGNLKGAFQFNEIMSLRSVAIVDDVITTGTTGNEIAALLKSTGSEHIQMWAIARAS